VCLVVVKLSISVLLSQIVKLDFSHACSGDDKPCDLFVPTIPKEKWQKKRTQVKLRVSINKQPNSEKKFVDKKYLLPLQRQSVS